MLTIKPPITLRNNPSLFQTKDNFCERLKGNYQLMSTSLEAEELLHLVSAPPEIYLAEGGMTSLVHSLNLYQSQDVKLQMIANVLNRVLVADTYRMTYQDQVYISSVLRKLGITDVRQFMSRFVSLKEQTINRHELTNLYWNNKEELHEMLTLLKEQRTEKAEEAKESGEAEGEAELFLHQQIFNRLQTGAVYEEVKNFLTSYNSRSHIYSAELQIGEQTVTAQNILLNKLKNYTSLKEQPLIYNHVNAYELGDVTNLEAGEKTLVQEMTKAVLLHLMDQMYALRYDQIFGKKDLWYHLEQSLYQSAENTLQRFEAYHSRLYLSKHEAEEYAGSVNYIRKQEITVLKDILERERERQSRFYQTYDRTREYDRQESERTLLLMEDKEGIEEGEAGSAETELIRRTDSLEKVTESQRLLRRELERINRQNEKNREILKERQSRTAYHRITGIDRQQAKKDALRILENPGEVMLEYLSGETRVEALEKQNREQISSLFSKETLEILETLERLKQTPELRKSGMETDIAQAQLDRDIQLQKLYEKQREREQQQFYQEELLVKEAIEETQNREKHIPARIVRQEHTEGGERMELVHKSQETISSEELLEELTVRNRTRLSREETNEEQVTERHTRERKVQQLVHDVTAGQKEDIGRLVNQSLQQQLNRLSDQIYGKLEKRLEGERRRRGL